MKMLECKRCLLNTNVPTVILDDEGVCNYCRLHEQWERQHTESQLSKIVKRIKREGKGKRYDVVVGVSGGADSSYMLHMTVELGLRPLVVHWNNNWNGSEADSNIKAMVHSLCTDYLEIGVKQTEYDDLCRSFLMASVPDADIPNDIALTKALYIASEKFDIGYIFEGHNFRTEGTTPIGWSYMDGQYIKSVQKKFGTIPLLTYPNLLFDDWLRYLMVLRTKRIRPLWYLHYNKEETKEMLSSQYHWQDYHGQHGENKYTIFISNYVQPLKFHIDLRQIFLSAQVRSGFVTRNDACDLLKTPASLSEHVLDEVKRRLHLDTSQLNAIMEMPIKSYHDYRTYHSTFRRYKPFFQMMAKMNLVPKTFVEKYTN